MNDLHVRYRNDIDEESSLVSSSGGKLGKAVWGFFDSIDPLRKSDPSQSQNQGRVR
jgi:hypothetical protein